MVASAIANVEMAVTAFQLGSFISMHSFLVQCPTCKQTFDEMDGKKPPSTS